MSKSQYKEYYSNLVHLYLGVINILKISLNQQGSETLKFGCLILRGTTNPLILYNLVVPYSQASSKVTQKYTQISIKNNVLWFEVKMEAIYILQFFEYSYQLYHQKSKLIFRENSLLLFQFIQISILDKSHSIVAVDFSILILSEKIKIQQMSNFQFLLSKPQIDQNIYFCQKVFKSISEEFLFERF